MTNMGERGGAGDGRNGEGSADAAPSGGTGDGVHDRVGAGNGGGADLPGSGGGADLSAGGGDAALHDSGDAALPDGGADAAPPDGGSGAALPACGGGTALHDSGGAALPDGGGAVGVTGGGDRADAPGGEEGAAHGRDGGTGARSRARDPLPWRLASVIGLLVLSPVAAEYLIGYDDSVGNPLALIGGLLILGPLYGGAALLIRETVRRTGGGWPAMILLAAAFGVVQAGLVDQSMFNDAYRDIDYWDDSRVPTLVPLLGISAQQGFQFVTGHVIWSVCAPIAVIEFLAPRRAARPWLGPVGLAVTAVLYLAASWLILGSHLKSEGAVVSAPQAIGAAVVIAALIGAAMTVGRRAAGRGGAIAAKVGPDGTVAGAGQDSPVPIGTGWDDAATTGAEPEGTATAGAGPGGAVAERAEPDGTVAGADQGNIAAVGAEPVGAAQAGPGGTVLKAGEDDAAAVGAEPVGTAAVEAGPGGPVPGAGRVGAVPVGTGAVARARRAWTPHPLLVGAATMALLAFQQSVPTWPGFLLDVGTLAALAVLLLWGARRPGWGAMHRLAAAGGALLTSAIWAFAVTPLGDVPYAAKLAHNTVILTGVVALLATAAWRIRRARRTV